MKAILLFEKLEVPGGCLKILDHNKIHQIFKFVPDELPVEGYE